MKLFGNLFLYIHKNSYIQLVVVILQFGLCRIYHSNTMVYIAFFVGNCLTVELEIL